MKTILFCLALALSAVALDGTGGGTTETKGGILPLAAFDGTGGGTTETKGGILPLA